VQQNLLGELHFGRFRIVLSPKRWNNKIYLHVCLLSAGHCSHAFIHSGISQQRLLHVGRHRTLVVMEWNQAQNIRNVAQNFSRELTAEHLSWEICTVSKLTGMKTR
jgi:hypothetical protein